MVERVGLDYKKILEEMARNQGDKDLPSYKWRIVRELYNLKMVQMYVEFKDGKWSEPQSLDSGHLLRELILVKKDVEDLKSRVKLFGRKGDKP